MTEGTFEGFVIPKKNYFPMPNVWIDICADIKNVAELKVVQYVLRHTWGFHEYGKPKAISVDEFMHGRRRENGTRMDKGTGLSNHSVIDGLKAAIKHGFLICDIDTSDLARVKKSYSLKMFSPPEEAAPGEDAAPPEDSSPQGCNIFTPGVKNLHSGGEESSHRSEKDTIETHLRKTLEERQDSFAALAPTLSDTSLLNGFDLTEEDLALDDEENITDAPTVRMPAIKKPIPSKPAQGTPLVHVEAEPEQDAPGQSDNNSHSQLSTPSTSYAQPEQQALIAPTLPRESARQAPKWTAEVMVAKAEELRGRAYSKITRPKEIKAAKKLFKRKEDISPDEFERVFKHRNDEWWHEHCGLLNVTDLAAVPKDKNDMRYMLELEKIEREAAHKQESETKKPPSRKPAQERVISSFGTPGFDFAAEFYPSEAEKRAYAAARQ